MSKYKLVIHAPNIHCGGGLTLLNALMQELNKLNLPVAALLDIRLPTTVVLPAQMTVWKFAPTLKDRFAAELCLRRVSVSADIVLCLSLPPFFKLKTKVVVFLQNRLLLDAKILYPYGIRVALRLFIERCWLRLCKNHADRYVIQTVSMQSALQKSLRGKQETLIMPFTAISNSYERHLGTCQQRQTKKYDFIYPASADYHKNHRTLIEAWCLLADKGLRPSLCLTINVNKYGSLWQWIEDKVQQYALVIFNIGEISHDKLLGIYKLSGALIFPSTFESFGLPMIEARRLELPILASERDFIRDIIDPEETFDPTSPISICRAVLRFNRIFQKPLTLMNAHEFLKMVIDM